MKEINLNKPPLSLYIHLPWCEKQCPYCDFNISTNKKDGDEDMLISAILRDLEKSKEYISDRKFVSVYFGGGTPSLTKSKNIEKILLVLTTNKMLVKDCEISFEFNPKEVDASYLADLSNIGINRASIGIQSFDNQSLKSLERNHDAAEAFKAIEIISSIKTIKTSVDLIYGVMGQTLDSFEKDIKTFCSQDVSHLSLYQLTIEPNTIFYKKELLLPDEGAIEKMEFIAKDLLEKNGFQQYEVSSWSKPGYESQHNLNYWQFGDFLGVGPGSHSKISNKQEIIRYRKIRPLEGYIQNQKSADLKTIAGNELDMDLAMNLLRIKNGLQHQDITIDLPASFLKKYQRGVDEGLLLKDKIGATQKGYQFLNETIQLFF